MFCGDLNGKEIQKRGDIRTRMANSLCCTAETNNIVKQFYSDKNEVICIVESMSSVRNKPHFIHFPRVNCILLRTVRTSQVMIVVKNLPANAGD